MQDKEQLSSYVKTRVSIPEALIEDLEAEVLKAFIKAPDSFATRQYGDTWLVKERTCVLRVPGRVVLEESNYLLNPLHPAFKQITFKTTAYQADTRLWQ